MKELIGIIHFEIPIPCRGDVLGHDFTTTINGVTAQITFPLLKKTKNGDESKERGFSVEKPAILQGNRKDDWGWVFCFNTANTEDFSLVGVWVNQVVVTCLAEDDVDLTVKTLAEGINKWRGQLYERTHFLGKSAISADKIDCFEQRGKATNFELYQADDYTFLQTNGAIEIDVVVHQTDICLTPDEIGEILSEIDISKHLRNEYKMFLNALVQQNSGNARYAIMEATTAAELCVTQKIKERCDELGIDGKGLCDAYYRSLGDRFNLLTQLRIPLATKKPNDEIVKPRNDLFHNRRLIPSVEECTKVLDSVKQYLCLYLPDMYE